MSSFLAGGGASVAAVAGSVVAGTVLAVVTGATLTTVVKSSQDSDSSASLKNINAPRYADE